MRKAEKAAAVAAVSYVLLGIYLLAISAPTQSIGLFAVGMICAARFAGSITVFLGVRFSSRRSEKFPLGLFKIENLVATFVGALTVIAAYEIGKIAVTRFWAGTTPRIHAALAYSGLFAATAVSGLLALYLGKAAKQGGSPGIAAEAKNAFADFVALSVAIAGVALEIEGLRHMGAVAVLAVSAYMAFIGGKVVFNGLKVLLDASVARDVLDETARIALSHSLVSNVLEVRGRNSGSYRFINLWIVLETTDLREAREIARAIESDIRSRISNVDRIMVEFEVEGQAGLVVAVPLARDSLSLARSLEDAASLEILKSSLPGGNIISREAAPNTAVPGDEGAGIHAAVLAANRGADVVLAPEDPAEEVRAALEAYEVEILLEPTAVDLELAERAIVRFATERSERTVGRGRTGGADEAD